MFFAPVVIDALSDVRYGFHDPELEAAERAFCRTRARSTRASAGAASLVGEIAASPQY